MPKEKWVIQPQPSSEEVNRLQELLNIEATPATLLAQRGLSSFDEAKAFFKPKLEDLHDPFLMKDMKKAVDRLLKALENEENILVYGDYDVDGTTAVSLMYSQLKRLHPQIAYYIPDRYSEGYGVSEKGIQFAIDNSFDLIITLDCGIKAHEKIATAQKNGIDVIVCDHHNVSDTVPNAFAILNPKQPDCDYPFKELCGCGVGFKFLQALYQQQNWDQKPLLRQLDLVATATAADIVPIIGENRTLAHFGLMLVNQQPSIRIKTLLKSAGLKKAAYSISDIVFYVSPRINAAGRISHGKYAVALLTAESLEEAEGIAAKINEENRDRKELDQQITQEALAQIDDSMKFSSVVYDGSWHKGVIGIVASRLIEQHYRPTVVLTNSNGHIAGSVRSIKGVDVYEVLEKCSMHLEQFGGHKYAAGLTLEPKNLEAFKKAFEHEVKTATQGALPPEEIKADTTWHIHDINDRSYKVIKRMEPFGPGNMRPSFYTNQVYCSAPPKVLAEKHLKLQLKSVGNAKKEMTALWWNSVEHLPIFEEQTPFQLIYTLEENHWNGNVTLQLQVKDIKPIT